MFHSQRIKFLIFGLFLATSVIFTFSCANMVAPSGGPKDTDPPKVVKSTPENFTTNFSSNSVRIYFDEYVQLNGIREKLIVSPPVETNPEFKLRGKSIIMTLNAEELQANTTYNIFFDDAIVDLTEANPIMNFRFVFSTGNYLDSLSVKGSLVDAFSLKPEEGVYVMLYDTIYDSVPYLEKPKFIAKANDKGSFEINYIKEGEYKMFALQDINANYIFDLPNEKIAFIDSLIKPEYIKAPELILDTTEVVLDENGDTIVEKRSEQENNTVKTDSIIDAMEVSETDSLLIDSIIIPEYTTYNLRLFEEKDTVQRIASSGLIRDYVALIGFRVETDSIYFRDIKNPIDESMYYSEFNENKDSLTLWITDTERDSLFLEIFDNGILIDTTEIALKQRDRARRGRASQTDTEESITFQNNIGSGRILSYFEDLIITANNPVKSLDKTCFSLWQSDTVQMEPKIELTGKNNRKLHLKTSLEQNSTYRLVIPDSCITDIYNNSHDTLKIEFKTDSEEDYGKISLNITLPTEEKQYILQLIDDKQAAIKERIITESGTYEFPNLKPAKYGFKLIDDENKDGKWTSGNYLHGIQPEKVYLFREELQIRAFWEMESDWIVNTKDPE